MKPLLHKLYEALTSSFWFLPTLMAMLAVAAALLSTAWDHQLGDQWVPAIGWVWSGSAEGARSVLSTVAGSLMTVISIVFSLTITTLAQTSSHFGPRVLRNFMADRGTQFVLGTFLSTFIFCLLVLRTIRSVEEQSFVPIVSVNLGIGLTLVSLTVLIYFIHHMARSIQAEHLIAGVGTEFLRALPHLFPDEIGHSGPQQATETAWLDERRWQQAEPILAQGQGYIQHIDDQRLMSLACQHQLLLRLIRRPGNFISPGDVLLKGLAPDAFSPELQAQLRKCFILGWQRTPNQDSSYALEQLVEIALRALSPGINEPYTAITCIDWIGTCLRGVAAHDPPSPLRRDNQGELRVIAPVLNFAELAELSLGPIRAYGAGSLQIVLHLLTTLEAMGPQLSRQTEREALARQARLLGQDAIKQLSGAEDHLRIDKALRLTLSGLSGRSLNF